jgi:hypothetical protein
VNGYPDGERQDPRADIGFVPVELGLDNGNGLIEIIAGQARAQNFAADNIRRVPAELYRLDVLGARAFRTTAFRVRYLLTFTQILEADALEARRVEK